MLVLSRRRGEGVTIGPDVRVVVLGIKGGQVRLGIEAPPKVEVHRDEVHARFKKKIGSRRDRASFRSKPSGNCRINLGGGEPEVTA